MSNNIEDRFYNKMLILAVGVIIMTGFRFWHLLEDNARWIEICSNSDVVLHEIHKQNWNNHYIVFSKGCTSMTKDPDIREKDIEVVTKMKDVDILRFSNSYEVESWIRKRKQESGEMNFFKIPGISYKDLKKLSMKMYVRKVSEEAASRGSYVNIHGASER